MNKRTIIHASVLLVILLVGTVLVSCGSSNTTPTPSGGIDGASLMQDRCSVCHSLMFVITAHKTADQWTVTVERMISHGAQLNAQEAQTLISYLAENYK